MTVELTPGDDTFIGSPADDVVEAMTGDLNAGDRLDGGAGRDTLRLLGPGDFDLASLAQFVGFEVVEVVNTAGGAVSVRLPDASDLTVEFESAASGSHLVCGSSDVDITATALASTIDLGAGAATLSLSGDGNWVRFGEGAAQVSAAGDYTQYVLAGGTATIQGGGLGEDVFLGAGAVSYTGDGRVIVADASVWNGSDLFDSGGGIGAFEIVGDAATLDVSAVDLLGSWTFELDAAGDTLRVGASDWSHIAGIVGASSSRIVTSDTGADLSATDLGVDLESTNGAGTTFVVGGLSTARHVLGGGGDDTLDAGGLALRTEDRDFLFAHGSVDTILDQAGSSVAPDILRLAGGADVLTGSAGRDIFYAVAGTLAAGDTLVGGGGADVLMIGGTGDFHLSGVGLTGIGALEVYDTGPGAVSVDLGSAAVGAVDWTSSGAGSRLVAGDGDLELAAVSTAATFVLGSGMAHLTVVGDANTVMFGGGDASVQLTGSYGHFILSTGDASISASGAAGDDVILLSSGSLHYVGGGAQVVVDDASDWNPADTFDCGAGAGLFEVSGESLNLAVADVALLGAWSFDLAGAGDVLDVSPGDLAHVVALSGSDTARVRTAAGVIDFTGVALGVDVVSAAAGGTVFTVADLDAAGHILGGAGDDRLIVSSLSLSQSQLDDLFSQGSIDTVQDANGDHAAPPSNQPPVAVDDTANALEAGGVNDGSPGADASGSVLANDSDPDAGDILHVARVNGSGALVGAPVDGAHGRLVLAATGGFTYVVDQDDPTVEALAVGQTLTEDFTYVIADGHGLTSTATLHVVISGADDAPTISGGSPDHALLEDSRAGGAGVGTATASAVIVADPDDSYGYVLSGWTRVGSTSRYTQSGVYGTATLDTVTGLVTYALANGRAAVEALSDGDLAHDAFQVILKNARAETISTSVDFTIHGATEMFTGGAGADSLTGTAYADRMDGAGGDDTLIGGQGPDSLTGGAGVDTVSYFYATAAVTANLASGVGTGGEGMDVLSGVERLVGSAYDDVFTGSAADNLLNGQAGNDTLDGRGGADTFIGGLGIDTVTYFYASAAVTANLGLGTAAGGEGADNISLVENLIGSAYNDVFTGSAGVNLLRGQAGDDTLSGGGGADSLVGGLGVDTASYAAAGAAVTVNLTAGRASGGDGADVLEAIENVTGSAHNDVLTGSAGANVLDGGSGDDTLFGLAGADRLVGGAGADLVSYVYAKASVTVSLAAGQASGGEGVDTLSGIEQVLGSAYADTLTGSAGADTLIGAQGDDVITGGLGGDTLTGGGGRDRFVYVGLADSTVGPAGQDHIVTFSHADHDRIDLSLIDAVTGGADDAFRFVAGGRFDHRAGALIVLNAGGGHFTVQADIDGDGVADFAIDVTSGGGFTSADFVL